MEAIPIITKLKVGDKIYVTTHYGINDVVTIDRVTPKRAFTKQYQFDIEVRGGWCKAYGMTGSGWLIKNFQLETPELKDRYEKMILVSTFENFQWGKLTLDELRSVSTIINIQ